MLHVPGQQGFPMFKYLANPGPGLDSDVWFGTSSWSSTTVYRISDEPDVMFF